MNDKAVSTVTFGTLKNTPGGKSTYSGPGVRKPGQLTPTPKIWS